MYLEWKIFCVILLLYYINQGNTELRERRSAFWYTPKMAPKIEKDWQAQLHAMEKRVMESIEKQDKK